MLDTTVFPNLSIHQDHLGESLYAVSEFQPGDQIYSLMLEVPRYGQIMPYRESYGECLNRGLGITRDLAWCPTPAHPMYYQNHGCSANCGLTEWGKITATNEIPIIAYTQIAAGTQILLYYPSITAPDDGTLEGEPWVMECLCGVKDCQHVISSLSALTGAQQRDYLFSFTGQGSIMAHLLEMLPELTTELAQRFPAHYRTYQQALQRQIEYSQHWQTTL
jgi:hypothetical protein